MLSNINFKLKLRKILLLLGDIFVLYLSLFLTLLLRFNQNYNSSVFIRHLPHFSIIFIFWLLSIFSFRLYEINKPLIRKEELAVNILNFSIINFFLSIAYFYIIPQNLITPKTILVINIFIFGIIFYFWRISFKNIFYSSKNLKKNSILLTYDQNLAKQINHKPELELNLKACINLGDNFISSNLESIGPDQAYNYIQQKNISTIVVDDHILHQDKVAQELSKCLNLRTHFIQTTHFYEKFLGKISLKNINSMWLINNLNESQKGFFDLFKNIIDRILSLIFLFPALILSPLIILAIKIDSPGKIFFTQTRTGKKNKKFLAIKFRTMYSDAEKNGPQWAQKNDSRVTKVGKFLRKSRLDEIPQLINILKGDMSLVGPRPERPEFIKDLKKQISFYDQRLLVKPGLTGWAQINYPYGNTIQDASEKLQYDLYYVKNRSLILDLSIVLKTIHTVIKKTGI